MANFNRRDVLRYGLASALTATTAGLAVQNLTANGSAAVAQPARDPRDFDEVYKGKKIKGAHGPNGRHELHINGKRLALTAISTLFVPEDGSPPHVGIGFISALNHYNPVEIDEGKHREGLKKVAKKVVDILGEHDLSTEAGQEHAH